MSKIKEIERKNKLLVILLCIALVFVMLLGGYVIYDEAIRDYEVNENDDNDNDNDNDNGIILDDNNSNNENDSDSGVINSPVVYKNPFIDEDDEFNKIFINKIKLVEEVSNYMYSDTNRVDIFSNTSTMRGQIPADNRLYSIVSNIAVNCDQFDGCSVDSSDRYIQYVDASLADREYIKLYGAVDYQHKDLTFGCPRLIFDVSNNRYVTNPDCGGTGYPELVEIVKSVNVDGDYVYVEKGIGCLKNNVLYKDYKCSQELKELDGIVKEKMTKEDYLALSQYKYTFVKNGENYIFEKIEKIN